MLLYLLFRDLMPLLLLALLFFGVRNVIFRLRRPMAKRPPRFTQTARDRVRGDKTNAFESHFSDEE